MMISLRLTILTLALISLAACHPAGQPGTPTPTQRSPGRSAPPGQVATPTPPPTPTSTTQPVRPCQNVPPPLLAPPLAAGQAPSQVIVNQLDRTILLNGADWAATTFELPGQVVVVDSSLAQWAYLSNNAGGPFVALMQQGKQAKTISLSSHTLYADLKSKGYDGKIRGWVSGSWINPSLIYALVSYVTDPSDITDNILPVVIDVSTGAWRFDLLDRLPARRVFAGVSFSPDLTRALYHRDATEPAPGGSLALFDLTQQTVLWETGEDFNFRISHRWGARSQAAEVKWSPDSHYLAMISTPGQPAGSAGLQVVYRNGSPVYALQPNDNPTAPFEIRGFEWSPDSRSIAVVVHSPSMAPSENAVRVLSMAEKATANECVFTSEENQHVVIKWAPGSRYFAVGGATVSSILVFDPANGAYFVPDVRGILVDWSN